MTLRTRAIWAIAVWTAIGVLTRGVCAEPGTLPRNPHPELQFQRLTTVDGLSHNSVFTILQDPRGFLWVGTSEGLDRYDGYQFLAHRADPVNPKSLAENEVSELFLDSAGQLWVGTWGAGLDRFDPWTGVFDHHRSIPEDPQTLLGSRVMAIHEDHSGLLWIGTRAGLNRLDPASGAIRRFAPSPDAPGSLSHTTVRAIAEDAAGRLWVGTNAGLDLFLPETESFRRVPLGLDLYQGSRGEQVNILHLDPDGDLWVGSFHGFHRMDPRSFELSDGLDASRFGPEDLDEAEFFNPNAFVEDHEGRFWIGTMGSGLFLFDPKTGSVDRYAHDPDDPESLAYGWIDALFIDGSSNLWVGTRGGGLSKADLKPRKFGVFPLPPNPQGNPPQVTAVRAGSDGTTWAGTSEGLLQIDASGKVTRQFTSEGADSTHLDHPYVFTLLEDRSGDLWIGTRGGLNRLGARRGRIERFEGTPGLNPGPVATIFEDRAGKIWIGNLRGGVTLYDPATRLFTPLPQNSRTSHYQFVLSILEDRRSNLWVGTYGNGLNRLSQDGQTFQQYLHDPESERSLSSDNVFSLHEDQQGRLWLGTSGGLSQYHPETDDFTHMGVVTEVRSEAIVGIEEDASGHLWLFTHRGLTRLDPETGETRHYGLDDGLPSSTFFRHAHHQDASGRIFAGTDQGLVSFHPGRVIDNPNPPRIVLTGIQSQGQTLDPGRPLWAVRSLEVSHRESFVAFEFTALEMTAPEWNRYAYLLEGLNERWVDLGTRRDLIFPHLESGRHVLRLKATNNDGIWSEEDLIVTLNITPPFWETWWFRGLAAAAASLLLVSLYRFRTRQIQRRSERLEAIVSRRTAELQSQSQRLAQANQEIQRFVNLISHDLRGPLLTIRGFIQELRTLEERFAQQLIPRPDLGLTERREVTEALEEDFPEALEFIASSTQRMDRLTHAILQVARLGSRRLELEWLDLNEIVEEVLESLRFQIEESGAWIEVNTLPAVCTDRFSIERIIENLLSNAVKYLDRDRPGRIVVDAEHGSHETLVRIRDNGRGVAEGDLSKIFEIFRRVGPQDTQGEGVGLACVQILVQQLGGKLDCTSEVDSGSTFTVRLPRVMQSVPRERREAS